MNNKILNLKEHLKKLRLDIDQIDSKILNLINSRLLLGKEIGHIKQENQVEVLDSSREKEVIEKILKNNHGPAEEKLLKYIFNVIMTATKDIQKRQIISFLGPVASHSHIASLNHFKHSGRFVDQPDIYHVFKNTNRNESHFGVIPVENSLKGSVNNTLDLFYQFDDLKITNEHYETNSYDLISLTGEKKDIKKIYAQPYAIAQCIKWKNSNFPDTEVLEVNNMSDGGRMAWNNIDCAIIASSQSAHIFNLQVVESAIEDYPGNITRFLIIGKEILKKTNDDKTSIMFSTSHTPGALFQALEPVNKSGLNMVKLESRPTRHGDFTYYFFMDIKGHIKDEIVRQTIKKMQETTLSLKHLGSYPVFKKENY